MVATSSHRECSEIHGTRSPLAALGRQVGALTCIYETVTERSEGQLKTANGELQFAKGKLAESEMLLKSVISNVPVMILVKDYKNQGRYFKRNIY